MAGAGGSGVDGVDEWPPALGEALSRSLAFQGYPLSHPVSHPVWADESAYPGAWDGARARADGSVASTARRLTTLTRDDVAAQATIEYYARVAQERFGAAMEAAQTARAAALARVEAAPQQRRESLKKGANVARKAAAAAAANAAGGGVATDSSKAGVKVRALARADARTPHSERWCS